MEGRPLDQPSFYREWAPPDAWRGVVVCCWEQQVDADHVQRVLPDGRADLLVYEDDQIQVVGLYDRVDLPHLPAGTRIRGIRLHPHAVTAAFHVDAASLRNRMLPLADIVGSRRAARLGDPRERDAWLRSIAPNSQTERALRLLARRSVDDTADALGFSARHLRRVVIGEIGLGPKMYQRVLRLQRFLAAAERDAGLAQAAAEAGYSDQSHLSREVQSLAGLAPKRLLLERRQSAS
jgi:AraC-like DNA-binding protein